MMNITIKLPDELVKQAQAAGIPNDDQVASLIQTELSAFRQARAANRHSST